jgi:acetyl coenzyme A synthetase (ADP forming)-like protein
MQKTMLSEAEGFDLLQSAGIPVPPHALVTDVGDALTAAEAIGYPVVMKIISPQIIHKSDVGGVITGIMSQEDVVAAYDTIMGRVVERAPDATVTGIIVEKEMKSGLEVLIGGKVDPAFGKVITFGLGGTLVELLKDVAIRVLPITRDEIAEMIREIQGYRLIQGYRGASPRDEDALADTITRMADLFFSDTRMVEFDLNPVILYESGVAVVDARIIVGERREEERREVNAEVSPELFTPKSIAVIGASANPNKVGYAVFRNLLTFPGQLYPVNPGRTELLGRRAYPSVAEIPGDVDLAVIIVPAPAVPDVMEECGRKGVRLAVIISSGFREAGEAGRILEEEVLVIAKKYGMRIVGPNCIGVMFPHQGINATFDPITPKAGHLSFISQSGAIITTIVDWSFSEEIGFSSVISVGNQADLGFEHYLKIGDQDPNTRSMILYIEEIRDGRNFMEMVREVAETTPVVAVKSGSSQRGKQAASSHTGSLAGSYEVYMAAFRQAGVIPVHSLREAFQLAELLASEGYPTGKRAVVITSAGGFAVLASDYAEKFGIRMIDLPEDVLAELNAVLPKDWSRRNPMDIVGDAGANRYARAFDVMIGHQDLWDIAFVVAVPTALTDPIHLANEIVRFSRHTRRMVVGCVLGGDSMRSGIRILRSCDIPIFSELEDAFKAVGNVLKVRTKLPEEATEHKVPESCMTPERGVPLPR